GEILRRHGDVLPRRRRAARQGEHVDLLVREQRVELPLGHLPNVRLHGLVGRDRDLSAKVVERADIGEAVLFAEVGAGVVGENAAQKGVLHLARMVRRRLERGEATTDRKGRDLADDVDQQESAEPLVDVHAGTLSGTVGAAPPRFVSKKPTIRRRYSSRATWAAWLCLASGTIQSSFGSAACSNRLRAMSGLM